MSSISKYIFAALLLGSTVYLQSCTTLPAPDAPSDQRSENGSAPDDTDSKSSMVIVAQPVLTPKEVTTIYAPPDPATEPPEVRVFDRSNPFGQLDGWRAVDISASFASFRKSCQSWEKADQNAMLNPNLPQYGRFSDWRSACLGALLPTDPHSFFEAHFTPVKQSTNNESDGLLTGYYEPEMDVRIAPDAEFSEPVLAAPKDETVKNLPRAELSARSSRVIAYGRPIDVFFLQVQGSGRLKFGNGYSLRAAYAGNNGKRYKSIGKVLVDRGALTLETASKQAIQDWMAANGPAATRELMNQNPRYIFFTEQKIAAGDGPRGAMRVPLTAMSSMAVDPRYHPYGLPIWLQTTLPKDGSDYRGQKQSVLVMAQDTGSAIRGPLRGDLFFGSGEEAGARAGVMKHRAAWTVFLPKALAQRNQIAKPGTRS